MADLDELVRRLQTTHSSPKVDDILDEIHRMGAEVVPDLISMARDRDRSPRVRSKLLEVAAAMDFRATKKAVYDASHSCCIELRVVALDVLSCPAVDTMKPQEAFKMAAIVVDMSINDPNPYVRQMARAILDEHGI